MLKKEIVDGLEMITRGIYGWLAENDEALGNILYTVHLFSMTILMVVIFISHTIYPVIWFQIIVFITVFLVWIQHILLRTCVCTSLERRLMGPNSRVAIDFILDVFGIPISKRTRVGVTLLMSTITVLFLGLELFARGVLLLRQHYGLSIWF